MTEHASESAAGIDNVRGSGSLYRRLVRNMAWLAGGTGAAALFNMLAVAAMARALTPGEFGLLILLQTSALLLSGVMSFATQQPVIQLGSAALHDGTPNRLGQVILLGLTFDATAALIAAVAGMLIVLFGDSLLGIPQAYRDSAIVFAASLLFTGYVTSNGIFRLLDRFPLLSMLQGGAAAATFAIALAFYFTGAGLSAYAWLLAGSMALTSQLQLWIAVRLARKSGVRIAADYRGIDRSDWKTFIAYCSGTWGMASMDALRTNGDSPLVGALVSVEAAGVYNVAKQVAGVVRKFTTIYGSAAFPEVSTLAARQDLAGARRLRRRMVAAAVLVGSLGVAAAVAGGGPFLRIVFGEAFAAGYVPLVILTAAAATQLISQTYSIFVQAFLGPGRLFVIYLVSTAVFVAAAPALTLWLATLGTAVAQLLFLVALTLICHLALRGLAPSSQQLAEPR